MVTSQENLLTFSSSVSKMFKRGFGKGPETCYTVLNGNRLFVYIRSFMTPPEEILVQNQECDLVTKFRSKVINILSEELLQEASDHLGLHFHSFCHDWNYDTNKGILLFEHHHPQYDSKIDTSIDEKKLFHLIRTVGSQLHKIPSDLKIVKYSQNTCAIESDGGMLPLEFLLYEKGNTDLLFTYSREVKKGYLQHKKAFEEIFKREIHDLYILWDCKNKRNYFIFSFQP